MGVLRRSSRGTNRPPGSYNELNISKGRNSFKAVFGNRSATSGTRPFNFAKSNDRTVTNNISQTPITSSIKPSGANSYTV